jgi:HrpA-like RNA helicase
MVAPPPPRRPYRADQTQGTSWLLPLHSTVAQAEQRRIFKVPPRGVRKVVLATNIAETSITVPDVVFVVDTGRVKEMHFDPRRGMTCLVRTRGASHQEAL